MEYYGYVVSSWNHPCDFRMSYHRLTLPLPKDLQDAFSQKWHHIITVSLPLCSLFLLAWNPHVIVVVEYSVKENHTVQFLVGLFVIRFV